MASRVTGLGSSMVPPWRLPPDIGNDHPKELLHGVVEPVHHPFLERDDGVVGDGDPLRAHLRAALRDVAVADPVRVAERREPVLDVEGMHLQRGHVHEEARAYEALVQTMVPQHVTDVLAEEALDALAEFLDAVHVGLGHAPGPVGRVRWPRLERLDLFLHREVPGHVRDQVLDQREGLHGLEHDRLFEREVREPAHAHELRDAVDLGRARPALAGLAVPAHGQVGGLLGLDAVDGVEHDHALRDLGGVVHEAAALGVATPDAEGRARRHYFISSMTCLSSGGISGIGTRSTRITPSAALRTTTLNFAEAGSLSGKSSRKWAPRLSLRSRAERVTASDAVSRFGRSRAVCQPGLYSRLPSTGTRRDRSQRPCNPSRARRISLSVRTMPTRSCIISWRS